jgi:cystathionine gamma-synthase
MEKAQENALKIARWLQNENIVTKVYYPGLPEHPGHELIKRQARGFGSMITFDVDSKEHALKILEKVDIIKFAESLGGVETLITYPTTQTHADVPEEVRLRNGITDRTLRLSVGIEDAEDLLRELTLVFASLKEEDHA